MSDEKQEHDNSGAIFRNKDKNEDHPNWPDYNGQAIVAGVEYWLACWMKEAKSGKKFMSIAFKPKEAKAEQDGEVAPTNDADSLPF